MNSLREQQESFARSVMVGVDESYASTICENGLSGARRLGIYQNGISVGLRNALAGVYEVVQKLVGDEYFAHLAEHYVRGHPSTSGNVHDFGENLPQFLETISELEALPYLSDVARLEWAYHAAFHSPIGEMLNIDKLAQVPESKYERLHLLLSPACFLLRSDFPVLRIWQVNQDEYEGDGVVNLDEGGVNLAIVRQGKQIVFHSLMPSAFAMLGAVTGGKTFDDSFEAALRLDATCDVGEVLHDAVMNKIVVGFSIRE